MKSNYDRYGYKLVIFCKYKYLLEIYPPNLFNRLHYSKNTIEIH